MYFGVIRLSKGVVRLMYCLLRWSGEDVLRSQVCEYMRYYARFRYSTVLEELAQLSTRTHDNE